MKLQKVHLQNNLLMVAPFTGAWIEILHHSASRSDDTVAPFTGAWIEILRSMVKIKTWIVVAPFTGAWIEMRIRQLLSY